MGNDIVDEDDKSILDKYEFNQTLQIVLLKGNKDKNKIRKLRI
jgi:hypothetical protein